MIPNEFVLATKKISRPTDFEEDYIDLIDHVIGRGTRKENRTGIGTISNFGGNHLWHSTMNGNYMDRQTAKALGYNESDELDSQMIVASMPLLTYRPIQFRIAWYETLMFLLGETNTKFLEERNIKIWKGNTSREFLDARGLSNLEEGDMGKGYGHQWREFDDRADQLADTIQNMIDDPYSRRHLVSAWNPNQLDEMALPPCHLLYQFNVRPTSFAKEVDIQFYMRSSDLVFGLPFNMVSYTIINVLVCSYLEYVTGENWIAKETHYVSGDAHVYKNQLDYFEEYMQRAVDDVLILREEACPLLVLPRFQNKEKLQFDSFLRKILDTGFQLVYKPYPNLETPRPPMAV